MRQKNTIMFTGRMIILGFGCLGRAVLPLLFKEFALRPEQIQIVVNEDSGRPIAEEFGVPLLVATIDRNNYCQILDPLMKEGDFLVNLSVNISSFALIELCLAKGVLYTDMSTEPWAGGYIDQHLSLESRTNYALRHAVMKFKGKPGPTAVLTHGANPGLVSHFLKHALCTIANDTGLEFSQPQTRAEWTLLAQRLNIKTIHIAERDTQMTNKPRLPHEFINTWSIDGLISEGMQPAELGWGTHERHWPKDAMHHEFGSKCAIYLKRPGAATRVRTWTPSFGPQHGFLITHAESISIAHYLTLKQEEEVLYRPTVHYAYYPSPATVLSLFDLQSGEWQPPHSKKLIMQEIIEGTDELGVLLMGHAKGAYWFGSRLSIDETRRIVPHNNATSLQVVAGIISAMSWAIEHPQCGVVEPEDLDYKYVLEIAQPYLGTLAGHYTSWTPLLHRNELFPEKLDWDDPWQFLNIRVN